MPGGRLAGAPETALMALHEPLSGFAGSEVLALDGRTRVAIIVYRVQWARIRALCIRHLYILIFKVAEVYERALQQLELV